jgi:hypothetical protein
LRERGIPTWGVCEDTKLHYYIFTTYTLQLHQIDKDTCNPGSLINLELVIDMGESIRSAPNLYLHATLDLVSCLQQLNGLPTVPALYASTISFIVTYVPATQMKAPARIVRALRMNITGRRRPLEKPPLSCL